MIPLRLDRFIGTVTFMAMCGTLLGGSLLMFIFTLLDMLQGSASESMFESITRAIRTMPRKIDELAPFAVFLGALIGLGNLSGNSELTVLRSAGVSVTRLFASTCIPSAIVLAIASGFIPLALSVDERDSQDRATGFSSGWLSEGATFTRIGWQSSDGTLQDIQQYTLSQDGVLQSSLTAKQAIFSADTGWGLKDVKRTTYLPDSISVDHFDSFDWSTQREPDSFRSFFTKSARKMSLLELNQQIDYLKLAGEDPSEFQIVFWSKLLKPLSVFGLVLIALVFVVGSSRVVGMGTRLTFGVLVGFAFHYIQTLIAPISIVFGVPALVSIATPVVLIWSIGLYLSRRMV